MNSEATPGRVTVRHHCPIKYLFIEWVKEWRAEEQQKESKLQYVYSKALASLKKYPLPLACGNDVKLLQNCGPAIAQKLQTKLDEFIELHGQPTLEGVLSSQELERIKGKSKSQRKRKAHFGEKNPICPQVKAASLAAVNLADSGRKPFVPKPRSGSYALLVALYNSHESYTQKSGLTKKANDVNGYYTAWNCMTSLEKKGLVTRSGHPPRFCLTQLGADLAHNLKFTTIRTVPDEAATNAVKDNRQNDAAVNQTNDFDVPSTSGVEGSSFANFVPSSLANGHCESWQETLYTAIHSASGTTRDRPPDAPSFSATDEVKSSGRILTEGLSYLGPFEYVKPGGSETSLSLNDAEVKIDEVRGHLLYKVKVRREHVHNFLLPEQGGNDQSDWTFAYVDEDTAPQFAPGLLHQQQDQCSSLITEATAKGERVFTKKEAKKRAVNGKSETNCLPPGPSRSVNLKKLPKPRPASTAAADVPEYSSNCHQPGRSRVLTFEPYAFEVVLCVDTGEVMGGVAGGQSSTLSRNSKERLRTLLMEKRVPHVMRRLNLGDFLWVARPKVTMPKGVQSHDDGGANDLVLNFIIERKRIDDLGRSIMDGRYKNQKGRLSRCGIERVIYLIESYNDVKTCTAGLPIGETGLLTSMAKTLVHNKFYLKQTYDYKETAEYLCLMTRFLSRLYEGKRLYSVPVKEAREGSNEELDLGASSISLIKFPEFQQCGGKVVPETVKDVFTAQLMQLSGFSAERAVAVTKVYPTPKLLLQAYDSCSNQQEKDALVAKLKPEGSQRVLGAALSRTLSRESLRINFGSVAAIKGKVNIPKKPPSAYSLFVSERMPSLLGKAQGDSQKVKFMNAGPLLSSEWKSLSTIEQQRYYLEANEKQTKYFEMMKGLSPLEKSDITEARKLLRHKKLRNSLKRTAKTEGMPKRPGNGYALFYKEKRKELKDGDDITKHAKEVATAWAQASQQEKEQYSETARNLMEKYRVEMEFWKTKMIQQGKTDVLEKLLKSGAKPKPTEKSEKTKIKVSKASTKTAKSAKKLKKIDTKGISMRDKEPLKSKTGKVASRKEA